MTKPLKKILIVEDHALNLKLFRDILRAKGFETLEDRVGRDCVKLAEDHQPVLIILDILLPFASGIDIATALKANEKTKHIPILGVTALAISGTHDKMIDAGCESCLTKPFTLDQFIKSIDETLSTAKLKAQDLEKQFNTPKIFSAHDLKTLDQTTGSPTQDEGKALIMPANTNTSGITSEHPKTSSQKKPA